MVAKTSDKKFSTSDYY